MPFQLLVTDDEIQYAKSVLLRAEDSFDAERVAFIKNFNSIDLQACPGSGKTTCLLAKLIIIGKHLAINKGGVLVLSHTNASIHEIRNKIFKYTPELFQYPNFIGTIQSFVDHFLAIPYYSQIYGHLPIRIDNEIFSEKIKKPRAAEKWLSKLRDEDVFLQSLRFDREGNLIKWIDGDKNSFPLGVETSTYKALLTMRQNLLSNGYLCYDDAYYLAGRYLDEFPLIIELLRDRFPLVFIDEMQDTDTHQMSLINTIFPTDCTSIIQKIGDQNQSIYGKSVKSNSVWIPREGHMSITGSLRLSTKIADTIKNISVIPQDLVGNISRVNINPKILLFDDSTIASVLPKFAEIIISCDLHKKIKPIFKAVGWVRLSKDCQKKGLDAYFNNYTIAARKSAIDFNSLEEYLYSDLSEVNKSGLLTIRTRILAAIVKALRIHDLKTKNNQLYTVSTLIRLLRENYPKEYEIFKLNIFNWSLDCIRGVNVKEDVKAYIKHLLLDLFVLEELQGDCEQFLNKSQPHRTEEHINEEPTADQNCFTYKEDENEVSVSITTIHGVKGETHTATLYLETSYQGKYESERILSSLKGEVDTSDKVRVLESKKMAYVGMTRATDLLCVALHKIHIPEHEMATLRTKWDIIDLTSM